MENTEKKAHRTTPKWVRGEVDLMGFILRLKHYLDNYYTRITGLSDAVIEELKFYIDDPKKLE